MLRPFRKLCILGALAFWSLFVKPLPGYSRQTPASDERLAGCRGKDLDTNLQFLSGPGDQFTVAFILRNISGSACLLDRGTLGVNGSPTVPDRTAPDGKAFGVTSDSENRVWGTHPPFETPPRLEPDKLAYMTIGWKTKPPKEGEPCVQPVAVNWPALVVAPTVLKQLCSEIEVSSFALGAFPGGHAEDTPSETLKLASRKNSYYTGQKFLLHVSQANPDSMVPPSENECPTLYWKEREYDRTVFRPAIPITAPGCHWPVVGPRTAASDSNSGNWQSGFDLLPDFDNTAIGWPELKEHAFQVFQGVASPDGSMRMMHSNILRVRFDDPSTIPRKWGPHTNGLAVNITMDKETFEVGEDIPLHLAVENFDSDEPAYGSLRVSVRDPSWTYHSSGVYDAVVWGGPVEEFPKGKVVPFEATLGQDRVLPKHAGTYEVTATFAPWLRSKDASGATEMWPAPQNGPTLQSVVTIHILDRQTSPPKTAH